MKKKTYPKITKLTPEEEAQLTVYRDEWIRIALSTGRMSDAERELVIRSVHGLYDAAALTRPKAIHIVPSPLAMAIKGGCLSYEEAQRKAGKKVEPYDERDVDAILKGPVAPYARAWYGPTQGGNMWAGWCAFLSFWRDVMKLGEREELKETYAKYQHWENLARISGYRWMAPEFCIVSEKPIKLETYVNARGVHVAHCEDGPSHLWGDGFAIYHLHGVRVPAWVIEEPARLTVQAIKSEENAEVRRVMRERFGNGRYLQETGSKLLDADFEGAKKGAAPRALIQDEDGGKWLVGTDGSTSRVYYMAVAPTAETCKAAHEGICGFLEEKIVAKS